MSLHEESFIGYSSSGLVANGSNDAALKNSYRLVILGAPKVGKTCIVNWFLGKTYRDTYIPTIEDFHRKIYKIRGEIYRLDVLDTSGNDPFPAMKKLNIMIGDLFVLVFSLDDIDSYVQAKSLCEQIIEIKKQKHDNKQHSKHINVPILIIGNKLDYLLENKIQNRCVDSCDIEKFISNYKTILYFETSCKSNIGLDRAFEKYFYQANLPIEMIPSKHRKVSLNLDLTKPQFSRLKNIAASTPSTHNENEHFFEARKSFKFKRANTRANKGATSANDSPQPPPPTPATPGVTVQTTLTANNGNLNAESDTNCNTSASNISNEQNSSNNNRNSFKSYARKSFRKMTFRRQLTEACGAVWLNARRPSIRAELNLLQIKTNLNIHLPLNHDDRNRNIPRNIFENVLKLFCCKRKFKSSNEKSDSKSRNSKSSFKENKSYNKIQDEKK